MTRSYWINKSRRLHLFIGWVAAAALFLFIFSGLMHILMVWTGPQAAKFFGPQTTISTAELAQVPHILSAENLFQAQLIQVVPTQQGNALQVTESSHVRRYFSLKTGVEWSNYDEQQARWLARYFTGLEHEPIQSIVLQEQFDNDYPWINRLLPVYRVTFDTPDQRTAYIYTEFAALAGLTNNWKNTVQALFQTFHTWQWLETIAEPIRLTLMLALLGGLSFMIVSGVALRLALPNRKIAQSHRRWHRRLALWLLVPLFGFLFSGIWHLLAYSGGERQQTIQLPSAMHWPELNQINQAEWLSHYQNQPVQAITLLQGPDNQLLYRVALPEGSMTQHVGHHQRFDGQSREQPASYYDVETARAVQITDADIARYWAKRHHHLNDADIKQIRRIQHFSPEYDFRNKRLPVWQVELDDQQQTSLFIDAATGLLVDTANANQRREGQSFSTLHKWTQMGHVTGQGARDALMLFVVISMLGFVILGIRMMRRQRPRST